MDWLTASILAYSISACVTLTDKYVVGKASANAYIFFIGCFSLLSFFLFPITGAAMPNRTEWIIGSFTGILFAISIYASFRAFKQEEVSRLAPLAILSTILLSIGASIFFNEYLSRTQYYAFGLFLVGAIFLATRIETKIELIDDITNFRFVKIGRNVGRGVRNTVLHPWETSVETAQRVIRATMDVFDTSINLIQMPYLIIHQTKKIRLIKGLGWYLIAIGFTIPYFLLSKELNTTAGTIPAYVSIRLGLFIGGVLIAFGNGSEVSAFFRNKKIFAIASVKEIFGMIVQFLLLVAITVGPIALVRGMEGIEAVGVLVIGLILGKFGIIKESTKRRDIAQKGFGVLCIVIATVLLF